MKDWTKKTMTRWQREMFERIVSGLCHRCKKGEEAIPGKDIYYHWEQNEKGTLVCGEEEQCRASVVRLEVAKVYGPLAARRLCSKKN